MEKQESVNGTTILTLGIVSLVLTVVIGLLGLICGLIAWSMGDTALKKLNAAGIDGGTERSNATIGRNCVMITALLFLGRFLLIWLT